MYKVLVLFILLLVITCCVGNLKLISYSNVPENKAKGWVQVVPKRRPIGLTEDIAVKASTSRSTVHEGGLSAIFLGTYSRQDLVATLENIPGKSGRYDPKKVQFFLVSDQLITAHSVSANQPAPDCEFVRAMHLTAIAAATSINPVILYDNYNQPVTLSGKRLDRCLVRVDVIEGYEFGGRVLFSNTENVCAEAGKFQH